MASLDSIIIYLYVSEVTSIDKRARQGMCSVVLKSVVDTSSVKATEPLIETLDLQIKSANQTLLNKRTAAEYIRKR